MEEFRYSTKNALYPVAYASMRAMHTRLEMVLVGVAEALARELTEAVEADTARMERLFNRHAAGAGLNVVNMLGRAGDVAVDDELFMVLELCEAFRRGTEGYFDITACSERAADTAAGYTLDAAAHTVRLHGAGALLDLGGFAKGYALERLRQRVAEAGVQQAVLNFGDSSITAIGHHPYGEWWPIGVEPDARRSAVAQEFRLRDSAMSVSGRGRGGEYHIFDPHSGERVVREETMVVEGRSALVCEVLSTALYAAPAARREGIMARYEGYTATALRCGATGGCEVLRIGRQPQRKDMDKE